MCVCVRASAQQAAGTHGSLASSRLPACRPWDPSHATSHHQPNPNPHPRTFGWNTTSFTDPLCPGSLYMSARLDASQT